MGEPMTEQERNELAKIHGAIGELLRRANPEEPSHVHLRLIALERRVDEMAQTKREPLQWPKGVTGSVTTPITYVNCDVAPV